MSSIHRVRDIAHPVYGLVKVFGDEDTISRTVAVGDEWEREIVEAMLPYITEGSEVLDIGANMGFTTLGLVKAGARASAYHCFEPQPDVGAILQYNLRDVSEATTYHFALGASDGELHTYYQIHDNIGGTKLADASHRGPRYVVSMTLDRLALNFSRHISLVKIDVEGAELAVIDGGADVLSSNRPALFIEIVDQRVDEVSRMLDARFGYRRARHFGGWDYLFLA